MVKHTGAANSTPFLLLISVLGCVAQHQAADLKSDAVALPQGPGSLPVVDCPGGEPVAFRLDPLAQLPDAAFLAAHGPSDSYYLKHADGTANMRLDTCLRSDGESLSLVRVVVQLPTFSTPVAFPPDADSVVEGLKETVFGGDTPALAMTIPLQNLILSADLPSVALNSVFALKAFATMDGPIVAMAVASADMMAEGFPNGGMVIVGKLVSGDPFVGNACLASETLRTCAFESGTASVSGDFCVQKTALGGGTSQVRAVRFELTDHSTHLPTAIRGHPQVLTSVDEIAKLAVTVSHHNTADSLVVQFAFATYRWKAANMTLPPDQRGLMSYKTLYVPGGSKSGKTSTQHFALCSP